MMEVFFEQQLRDWPLAAANYGTLGDARNRNFNLDGLDIWLKCIPQRLRSAAADTSKAGIAARPCFLCSNQLPSEQRSLNILYDNKLIRTTEQAEAQGFRILVNPFPVFSRHFTIAAVSHREQSLLEELPALMALAEFMPDYVLFYNAPGAGASAPDHLHFQACPKGSLPVERDFAAWTTSHSEILFNTEHSRVYNLKNFLRSGWLLRGQDPVELCSIMQEALKLLSVESKETVTNAQQNTVIGLASANSLLQEKVNQNTASRHKHAENNSGQAKTAQVKAAMVNLLVWYTQEGWNCLLFARSKHRPDCYFKTGAEQIMISPAAVEMGGLIVLARPEDFEKVTPALLSQVYAEVSLSKDVFRDISEQWRTLHSAIKTQKP